MRPFAVLIAALALSLADAAAQERRPLVGEVTGPDGKPLGDAQVQLAYVPTGGEGEVAADHPTATTDARGRFRIDLLPCTNYRAWAVGPPDAEGTRFVSELACAAAGQTLALQATHEQQRSTLTIEGLDAWPELAPFQLRVLPYAIELNHLTVPIDNEGKVVLPALPKARICCEVLAGTGQPIDSFQLWAGDNRLSATVQPPRALPMRAVDGTGAPIAGVEILQRVQGGWVESDGIGPAPPSRLVWRQLGTTAALAELRFTLPPASPLRGHVVLGANSSLANLGITLRAEVRITNTEGNGWSNEALLWHTTTDAAGRFTFADLPPYCNELTLAIDGGAALPDVVPPSDRRFAPPRPIVLHRLPAPPTNEVVVDLAKFHTLHLRVLDQNKGPARNSQLLLLSRSGEKRCDGWTLRAVPDSAGRLALRVQPGPWLVFVRDRECMVWQSIEAETDQEIALQLEPMPAMRGKVTDGEGKPIAGAQLSCHSMSMMHLGKGPELQVIASQMNWIWIGATRTDNEGHFVCRYLQLPNMSYECRFHSGDKQSPEFRLKVDEDPVTVVIE